MTGHGDLAGKVVVITGAARGVGAAMATAVSARGASVALVGLEPEGLRRVTESCGARAAWWKANVTEPSELADAARQVVERFGRVDAVVANAGIASGGTFLASDPAVHGRVIEVNLLGSITTARTFLPELIRSRGYLMQIASLAAIAPAPLMSAYCASKAGVEAFAQCLRAEVAHQGVGVGVAYLSWTDTDMLRGGDLFEPMARMRASLPLPLSRTYPLDITARRLVDGLARRSGRVYGQRWLRVMQPVRGVLPLILARAAPRRLARFRDAIETAGPLGALGPGGAADAADRAHRQGTTED